MASTAMGQPGGLPPDAAKHTDPINLQQDVRDAHTAFYNLDYDRALGMFEAVQRAHPQDPMATDYVLMVLIFRELYHQDLLDTTYYAHDSFLSSKRTVSIADGTRQRIESLTDSAIALCDQALKQNPDDKNALFARGYARGMHAAFITLADHSYVTAARQGLAARNDSEAVLKLDAGYQDAKMAVGIQQFAVASLPRLVRMMVGIAGVGGSREKGLGMLRDAATYGIVTRIESRTTLSLFLRHDGRYPEALVVQQGLAQEFPHDYLFRLEQANLTKDEGNGPQAIAAYRDVLADARKPGYFIDPRLQMAWFGLADTERGQNDITDAAKHYLEASEQPNCSDWLRRRAQLNAGQMLDLLHDRGGAVKQYQMAAAGGGDQSQADAARRYLKAPYDGK
ncbi:tetratricopeptide repeat protein [Granulicella arctica]|uniref:tetratricopeptide repeat protein n=1 Tax=Granulicella arctica TaxID=940613 RepID=UPI0021E0A799|nr:tetratricopeptide repeat protein [Granulicella arctica]